ncbi:MAG: chemotaxis protein CheX [Thermodesulfobacteriota bacterium]|nr:chemotaxis protein CheX [Thermodesulfobacteriota bacterium]
MERTVLRAAMKTSISDVLETMFFVPLEFSESVRRDDRWRIDEKDMIMSKVSFTGPLNGYFVLSVPLDVARSITGNFLGRNEDKLSQKDIEGTVQEIVNMMAGSTFFNYDDQAVFSLGIPEVLHLLEAPREEPNWKEAILVVAQTPDNYLALEMVMT